MSLLPWLEDIWSVTMTTLDLSLVYKLCHLLWCSPGNQSLHIRCCCLSFFFCLSSQFLPNYLLASVLMEKVTASEFEIEAYRPSLPSTAQIIIQLILSFGLPVTAPFGSKIENNIFSLYGFSITSTEYNNGQFYCFK